MKRPEEESIRQRPPLEWYTGFGFRDTGILVVLTGIGFHSVGDGTIGRRYNDKWLKGTIMPLPKDATEREKILRERDEAARYIEDSVGFSPQEIQDYQDELTRNYAGKYKAPFRINLVGES